MLTSSNSKPAPSFDAAFYLRDIASLDGKAEQEKFLTMPMDLIQLTSPDILAIQKCGTVKMWISSITCTSATRA